MSKSPRFGARLTPAGTDFAVWSRGAGRVFLSLFDAAGERETDRIEMAKDADGRWSASLSGAGEGTRYGFRADGPFDPEQGLWFDPDKILVDPYAVAIDRPYRYDSRLAARRGQGADTAPLVPKAVVTRLPRAVQPDAPVAPDVPVYRPGGLIYELSVRGFSMRHPAVPEALRGTVAALAQPAIIEHLKKIGVSAVELMPVTAWIDERHLGPLGLSNAWGYNPVTFMALDPRLAPGGIAELRAATAALRAVGIGVILDLVFNHTGESDALGPTLSLRGLDNRGYYRHRPHEPGVLVNDTGTGNTLACDHPVVRRLVLDTLRHFVLQAGVDGFRFDLAPVLGRDARGFAPDAVLLDAIRDDPVLKGRVLIAEPWDVGPDGYQLGRFGRPFLEWNDRYRDDVRRFWRGDRGMAGRLATRLAGSSDVFGGLSRTRTVNFLAAHDGFTFADLVRYERKHNEANGEANRDGHDENLSWNNGAEGESDDPRIRRARQDDLKAMLSTLFVSRGAIMLTAGDEFGRSQAGNNNAYAQDNALTWLDWDGRDTALEGHVAALAALRARLPLLAGTRFLTGRRIAPDDFPDVEWLTEAGLPLDEADWSDPERRRLTMLLADGVSPRVAVLVNGDRRASVFSLPAREAYGWAPLTEGADLAPCGQPLMPGRSCHLFMETAR
jgi:glycogen operon protein